MASVDIVREDSKDGGSPTIPPIVVPSITNTAAVAAAATVADPTAADPTAAAVVANANADTNMPTAASKTDQETTSASTSTTTNGTTTNATATSTNATPNATTNADSAATATNTNTVHRTIKTIRKIAKRTPFPVTVAPSTATVAEENGAETVTTLQLVDNNTHTHNHAHTEDTEATSAMKVTQEEEGDESDSEDDDIERRDAPSKAIPVATAAAAAATPTTTDVPTTTKSTKTTTTTRETDTARILKLAVEPHLNDVLFVDDNCQEDSKINKKWPGNRQYRAWIQARVFDFQHAASRSEQTRVAKQVSGLVRRQNPVGRFLERLSLPVEDGDDDDNNAAAAAAARTRDAGDKKSKSVWVELDETAVLMELSKSLWEAPLENSKLSDKQQQMLLAKQETAAAASGNGNGSSPTKNGDKKKDNGNGNGNGNTENGGRTSQHEQQLLLQHAQAASQYGDYFHTLYITPVYSDSQMPSSNTTASMMQRKQQQQQRHQNQQPQQQQQQKRKPQRKLTLNKSAPASFESNKRRPLDQGRDWPNAVDNAGVEMDETDIRARNGEDNDGDDNKSEEEESHHDRSGKSVDGGKLTGGKTTNGKAKRKSTGTSNDTNTTNNTKRATKQPKRSNSESFDKPNKPAPKRKKGDAAKRNQRSSNGTIVVSPLPTEPARRKPFKTGPSGLGFTTTNGDTVAITKKANRAGAGGTGTKDTPKPAARGSSSSSSTTTTMKKSEKKSSKQTTTDELGLPRGVTMRPSGKWQAQFYFAGQSRYIGVFQSAYDAAAAYEIVRERLDQARKRDSRGNSTLTKEARSQLFDDARRAAHEGVFENKEDNEYNASLNYANKSRPSEEEYAAHAAEAQAILLRSGKPEDLLEGGPTSEKS